MSPGFRSAFRIIHGLSEDERRQLQSMLGASHSHIDALVDTLLDPDRVRSGVGQASEDALTALKTWVVNQGIWREPMRQSRLAEGIQELSRHGWVFEAHYGPYRRIPLMPWEMMRLLLPMLWEIPKERLVETGPPRSLAPAPLWPPLIHDIFQCLAFARQEPLLLTSQHSVYRRLVAKVEKLLWARPAMQREAVAEHLLSALDHLGFFEIRDTPYRYEVSTRAVEFLHQSPGHQFASLVEFIFDPSRIGWPSLLWASLASLIDPGKTLNVNQCMAWMSQLGVLGADHRYLFNQAVQDLMAFDIWEVTGEETGRLTSWAYAAFRGHFEAPEPRSALVQPTGEILVPPMVPLGERWAIDGLASRIQSDRVSTYRIDQASVRRGIRNAFTAASHAEALEELVKNPLPDNVRTNLDDWYRQYGRHRVMEVTLVHSDSAEDSRTVELILGNEAIQRLSPTDVIIAADRVKDVVKRLDKAGHPMLSDVLRPSATPPDLDFDAYPPGDASWPVRLPGEPLATQTAPDNLRGLVADAARQSQYLSLTFQLPGESRPRTELVMPVTLERQWIQVYVISQRRYILVGWQQILSAELESRPV